MKFKIHRGLSDIPGLYDASPGATLVLSHAHKDYYGLINSIDPDCPIYLGGVTHKLIKLTNLFTHQEWTINREQRAERNIPPHQRSCRSGYTEKNG